MAVSNDALARMPLVKTVDETIDAFLTEWQLAAHGALMIFAPKGNENDDADRQWWIQFAGNMIWAWTVFCPTAAGEAIPAHRGAANFRERQLRSVSKTSCFQSWLTFVPRTFFQRESVEVFILERILLSKNRDRPAVAVDLLLLPAKKRRVADRNNFETTSPKDIRPSRWKF